MVSFGIPPTHSCTQIVLQMLLEICTAVESCHQKKVIHRDLKPENILLDDMGRVKLSQFE